MFLEKERVGCSLCLSPTVSAIIPTFTEHLLRAALWEELRYVVAHVSFHVKARRVLTSPHAADGKARRERGLSLA